MAAAAASGFTARDGASQVMRPDASRSRPGAIPTCPRCKKPMTLASPRREGPPVWPCFKCESVQ